MTARYIERFVLIFLLFIAVSNSIARAGDYASRKIIGFSAHGHFFAFEQYGVQDGSGFPYSEIFVLDTERDEWVENTPIRKRLDDERAQLSEVREAAMSEARPVLSKLGISEPGTLLASNPRAELSADPKHVVVNAAYRYTPPKEAPVTFTLSEKAMKPGKCGEYTSQPINGFTLTMTPEGGEPLTLHDDQSLPASRGCTLGYGISDVIAHEAGGQTTYAVLLHVLTVGFEGPDSRFLAVTRRLPSAALSAN